MRDNSYLAVGYITVYIRYILPLHEKSAKIKNGIILQEN